MHNKYTTWSSVWKYGTVQYQKVCIYNDLFVVITDIQIIVFPNALPLLFSHITIKTIVCNKIPQCLLFLQTCQDRAYTYDYFTRESWRILVKNSTADIERNLTNSVKQFKTISCIHNNKHQMWKPEDYNNTILMIYLFCSVLPWNPLIADMLCGRRLQRQPIWFGSIFLVGQATGEH